MHIASTAPAEREAQATTTAPGFGATVRSEWTKFSSARSNWVSIAVALVLSAALTALIAWATGFTWDDWNAADQADFDPITFSLSGLLVAGIVFVVLGVNLAASEYSSGMIRRSPCDHAQPRSCAACQMSVIAAVTTVAALVVNAAIVAAGNLVFGLHDMPTASLTDRDTVRAIAGLTLVAFVFPIIGVAMAFIFRSSAAAITAVLALLFLPSIPGGLPPRRWQEDVLAWLPGPLTDSVSIGFLTTDSAMTKGVVVSVIGLIIWLVLFLGAAWVLLNCRDAWTR
ncbi:MAG: hypothetical protein M9947_03160 [Thermomicrobiales bacterium]|nr:hypothetical protein [Thermomicrobiales bacterium]